ncbi:MAG: DNA helicase UvrD [Lachnospiraceae bacterium]|nr:DNA helicase UvrD [Lachnospiraceae bacterium]
MAKNIDIEPKYEGEKKVWNSFRTNLPNHWVFYNNRSVNGREYDFCVMAPDMGLFIVEVKGWSPESILTVVNENTIFISGYENTVGSPRGQARGYRFDLLKKINRELGMNPLIMSFVCYPLISKDEYYEKGLNIVSEENETIFAEELLDSGKLYQKFIGRYNIDKGAKHDELSVKRFSLIRHHFEPNYDLKNDIEYLNPGYSRLRVFRKSLTDKERKEVIDEYFKGIKEIVFLPSREELLEIVKEISKKLKNKNIFPEKGNLVIGKSELDIEPLDESFNIFNFEIEVVSNLSNYLEEDLLIEEGECSETQRELLKKLSEVSKFNYQQYVIEHAPSDKNILVAAGAGTGKTFSMVSRVAYLCNRTVDAVVDIVSDIAMITFTNDAAENMNKRVKRMFMNYFILTANEKYMHLIEDMNQIQISTIHKFAISLLKKDCMRLGIGYDCQVTSESFNRKQLYHYYLNEYLQNKTEDNPDFARQLTIPTYKIEELLISFCDKLYDRSVDIKGLEEKNLGEPTWVFPFFNEMIMEVAIKAEIEYAKQLKENNLLSLRECMIQINELTRSGKLMKQGINYKYVFIDEFQDTDDVQIETITDMQKVFGEQCRLFIVGDLKQSIYRFRGATLSAFEKVKNTSDIGEWQPTYVLTRNYRTDRRLLDLFNNIFIELGKEGILPYREEVDRLTSQIVKEGSSNQLLKKIEVHSKNKEGFFDDLFVEIKNQIEEINVLCEKNKLSREEKTIAILVRYNYQIANIVRAAEQNPNVDFAIKVSEGGDLYRLRSSSDLYKLVLAVTHPYNEVYLANFIQSNYVSLKINMSQLSGLSKKEKLEELIYLLDEYFMLHMGKTWAEVVEDFQFRPVLVALRDIYEALKPWKCYKDEFQQGEYRENYELILEKMISKYSRDYLTINKIYDFLKINITTYQEEASRKHNEEDDDVIVLCTTVHKSKGLEYGTVVLPYTSEDISDIKVGGMNVNICDDKVSYSINFKGGNSGYSGGFDEATEEDEKIKEETRVLYVALTRAIRNIVWMKDLDTSEDISWGNYMEVIE